MSSVLKFNYLWRQKDKITFFSGVGIGLSLVNVNNGRLDLSNYLGRELNYLKGLAYQIDLIGVDYKFSKNLSITSILGYGTNGYTQLGLTYNVKN